MSLKSPNRKFQSAPGGEAGGKVLAGYPIMIQAVSIRPRR